MEAKILRLANTRAEALLSTDIVESNQWSAACVL
jgi:hypothetical protein